MNAIVVKNLTKKYGANIAVDNLSFQVKKGKVFGLIGANGAAPLSAYWEQRKWTPEKSAYWK